MSQNDFSIANASGSAVRADVNSALQALASLSAGPSPPSTTYGPQWYFDATNDILKIRREDNTSWVNAFSLVGGVWIPYRDGVLLGTMSTLNFAAINQALAMAGKPVLFASHGTLAIAGGVLDLATANGNRVTVSGTGPVTGLGTVQAGAFFVLHVPAAYTFTQSASLIIAGGADFAGGAGDVILAFSDGGGTWRLFPQRADGSSIAGAEKVVAFTSARNVTASDRGKVLRFTGSADTALTFDAAAALGDGFAVTVVYAGTNNAKLTFDPNGSETLDGVLTRATRGGKVKIVCDGAGFHTVAGAYVYKSGNQTITASSALTLTHDLGKVPDSVRAKLKCTSAEAGYSVNDEIYVPATFDYEDGYTFGVVLHSPTATQITGRFGNFPNTFAVPNKTTSALTNLTNTKWAVIIEAEAG